MSQISKLHGSVYTPFHIVDNMLNLLGYTDSVLFKHIIDNSCGDGAFLSEVVKRYCSNYYSLNSDPYQLKSQLETYIHGLDNDSEAVQYCIENLNSIVNEFGLDNVAWDIKHADTLEVEYFNNKMDFVVGNPPYIRVHNLRSSYKKVKEFSFANNGMTDLFIVFFELGFRMLNSTGRMALITPSSYLRSLAGTNLRKYIWDKRNLCKVVDLEHYQPFNATTYTMISIFDNQSKCDSLEYFTYDDQENLPIKVMDLDYSSIFINGKIFFSQLSGLNLLHKVENKYRKKTTRPIIVKNGFATLADKVFIGDFNFENLLIDVLKASTGKWYKGIFPYDNFGNPLSLDQIAIFDDVYSYLMSNKEKLITKDNDDDKYWYLYGRSQAIKDVFIDKIAVNTIIKDISSLKIQKVAAGKGLYSGLYILSNYSLQEIKSVLETEEFIDYLRLLKNYKSGGYYSFSSIDLEKYLYYKLEGLVYEQYRIF